MFSADELVLYVNGVSDDSIQFIGSPCAEKTASVIEHLRAMMPQAGEDLFHETQTVKEAYERTILCDQRVDYMPVRLGILIDGDIIILPCQKGAEDSSHNPDRGRRIAVASRQKILSHSERSYCLGPNRC